MTRTGRPLKTCGFARLLVQGFGSYAETLMFFPLVAPADEFSPPTPFAPTLSDLARDARRSPESIFPYSA